MAKPVFSLVAVASLDGRIARDSWHFTDWSSKEDKAFLGSFLGKADAVVVGMNTWRTAKERLSRRNCIVFTSKADGELEERKGLVFFNPAKADFAEFASKSGLEKVAVLGGTKTFSYFLEKGLVDRIYLTIEPVVFGSGLGLFDSKFGLRGFRMVSSKRLNKKGSLLLVYSKK